MNRFLLLFPLLAMLAVPSMAQVKTRAILVGVSDYYNLDPEFDLKGPKNDVREVARYLLEQGVAKEDIVLLSDLDAMPGGELTPKAPVKKAIFDALDEAASTSGNGDRVIFYFSGHGSLQPDLDGDELGGRDEIFLPADVGKWSNGIGAVENAIVDDELRIKMQAIRDTGATLFAIIDACFSGTGFRGISSANSKTKERSRFVPEAVFGFPKTERSKKSTSAAASSKPATKPENTDDKFVYFYASQADQRSWEYPVAEGAGDDQWFGDFTFNLLKVLRQSPGATYRQVMQEVVARMRGRIGGKLQQPDYEGTLLDEPVWQGGKASGNRRYRIEGGELQAGILDGLNENAVLAIYAGATDKQSIAHARTAGVKATKSSLDAIRFPCDAATDCSLERGLSENARYAELIENPADVTAVFSLPILPDGTTTAQSADFVEAVNALATSSEGGFVFDRDTFDLSLIISNNRLIIGDSSGSYDTKGRGTSLRFSLPDGKAWIEHLPEILTRVSRVHALYRISESFGAGGGLLGSIGKAIKTRMLVETASPDQRKKARCRRSKSSTAPMLLTTNRPLSHCDKVIIEITNKAVKNQDVTVLYVDANLGITALWPRGGKSNRLGYKETVKVPIQIVTRSRSGKKTCNGIGAYSRAECTGGKRHQ